MLLSAPLLINAFSTAGYNIMSPGRIWATPQTAQKKLETISPQPIRRAFQRSDPFSAILLPGRLKPRKQVYCCLTIVNHTSELEGSETVAFCLFSKFYLTKDLYTP